MEYEVIRSKRKTITMQLRPDGTLLVRAPLRMSTARIRAFVAENQGWLEKARRRAAAVRQEAVSEGLLTQEDLKALTGEAKRVIPERVAYYAPLVGVSYGRITIRRQKTRWGSCSAAGNLNFNCLLMLTPPEVLDSVVVHELCHRREMNHSKRFYAEVLRVYPDYYACHRWLKQHGAALLARMEAAEEDGTGDGI